MWESQETKEQIRKGNGGLSAKGALGNGEQSAIRWQDAKLMLKRHHIERWTREWQRCGSKLLSVKDDVQP